MNFRVKMDDAVTVRFYRFAQTYGDQVLSFFFHYYLFLHFVENYIFSFIFNKSLALTNFTLVLFISFDSDSN